MTAPPGDTAHALLALAEATERQAKATERQNVLTEKLLAAVRRKTILTAMGCKTTGHLVFCSTADVCALFNIGETKLAELRTDGVVVGFQMKRGGPWFYSASSLGAAVRVLAERKV